MSTYIGLDRLKTAVLNLFNWRGKVKQQTTAHLFPLLALVEKGVGIGTFAKFEEADDYAFFDHYLRIAGNSERPYFDPFTRTRRIASHPHSNVATARKNTFANRWKAGTTREGDGGFTEWSLLRISAIVTGHFGHRDRRWRGLVSAAFRHRDRPFRRS